MATVKYPTILVTGATGNVGRELVSYLAKCDCHVRIADRAPGRPLRQDTGEIVYFDFADRSSYEPALSGVDSLFLLRPPAISDVDTFIAPVIRAARDAGVTRIVFLSIQGVESTPWVPHYKIEQCIVESGVAYTFLRCGFFMQNLATTHQNEIRDDNEIVVPAGKSVTAFVDTRDIAEAAAGENAFTESAESRIFTLTGPAAITYQQAASILSETLKRNIRYRSIDPVSFMVRQRRMGKPWRFTFVMTMLYTITRFGNASEVTNDLEILLGRPPTSFERFALDYRSSWIPR
jgi:uncharacterized protein YbjT (DUF2867 family)